MRILLVEDDDMIARGVQHGLRPLGFTVDRVADGLAAELALAQRQHDALLLDLGLPRKDGLAVLEKLRAGGSELPVLVLTARDTVADRVAGLDADADDYVVKPFDLDELAARIRAVARRRGGRADPTLAHGALALNPATREVRLRGQAVNLSAREYDLLFALLSHPGQPQSRAQLEERLYGWGEEVESNAVEVHIHGLRRKLGAAWIRNLRGVGYFVPQEPPESP
ncbi:DNA-binding response regulator [Chitiniphilus shinanonensis]|uniref:DNA-binding response regulator n=1 Tax=Chitiniphilus shinanonensis TaxID=553088 RepID=A0ABQ6BXF5_9NEIS|nr:response regulator transcription factor [Chitiniphilus shinanonensis]GLS04479.1 DNA-binding response regulator [Chitiniphilus shinanonensis]